MVANFRSQPQSQSLKESCLPSYLKCKALAVWVFRGSQFYHLSYIK